MIALFPLTRLTLEENTYYQHDPLVTIVMPRLPLEWTSNIRVIHLWSLLHRDISVLGMFLRELGPSLTHLYLVRLHFLRYLPFDGRHQYLFYTVV